MDLGSCVKMIYLDPAEVVKWRIIDFLRNERLRTVRRVRVSVIR